MLRSRRVIALAVVAAGALTVLGGTGTASATVFCSTTSTPCGSIWPANTTLSFALKTNVPFKFVEPGGGVFDECPESNLKTKIVKAGSSTETVTGPIEEWVWGNCKIGPMSIRTVATLKGKIEVHNISGSDNGTVTADGESGVEFGFPLMSGCIFELKNGTDLGLLTAGSPATLDINATLVKISDKGGASCPLSLTMTAEYTLKEPGGTTLDVEPS